MPYDESYLLCTSCRRTLKPDECPEWQCDFCGGLVEEKKIVRCKKCGDEGKPLLQGICIQCWDPSEFD